MPVQLLTITNLSPQVVPILVDAIDTDKSNALSDISPTDARQMQIAPGAAVTIERQRVDLAQLDRLRGFGLLSYS